MADHVKVLKMLVECSGDYDFGDRTIAALENAIAALESPALIERADSDREIKALTADNIELQDTIARVTALADEWDATECDTYDVALTYDTLIYQLREAIAAAPKLAGEE